VLRLSERLDRNPAAVLRRVGVRDATGNAPSVLALALPPEALAEFAHACSLSEDEAADLTLAPRYGDLLGREGLPRPEMVQAAVGAWISPGRTRYCPDCLLGDGQRPGYWRASWLLPWHFACLRHLRLLAEDCPACQAPVGLRRPGAVFGALLPNEWQSGLTFDACRYVPALRARACGWRLLQQDDEGRDFREAALTVPALRAQQRLDDLLGLDHDRDPEARATAGGIDVSRGLWFEALREVIVLVRASLGTPTSAPSADGALAGMTMMLRDPATPAADRQKYLNANVRPEGAWATCELVVRALHVLDASTREDLHERLAPYREGVSEHLPGVWKTWLRSFSDADVKALLKPSAKWGALTVATRGAPRGKHGLRGRDLSQRVPPPHDLVLQPFAGLGVNETGLHRAAVVLLYQRREGALPRKEVARALGYDRPGDVDGTVRRLQAGLTAAGLSDAFIAALDDLEVRLGAEPRVDWARRRDALAEWSVSDEEWAGLQDRLRPLQKRDGRQPDWGFRRYVVSQILWEDLTRGEPLRSPVIWAVQDQPRGVPRLRRGSVQFRGNITDGKLPGVAGVLDDYRHTVERTMLPWEHSGRTEPG